VITFAAAAMLMVTMGARQSLGLFVAPLNTATGLGVVTISFAMAVNQFVWGAVQPFAGAVADRYGAGWVLVTGVLIFALGSALTPQVTTSLELALTVGLLSAMGSGAVSFSVLIGAVARRVLRGIVARPPGQIINAGSSFRQLVVFAPLLQMLISVFGWMGAMRSLAVITLATLPARRVMGGSRPSVGAMASVNGGDGGLWAAVRVRSRIAIAAAPAFTCGFHRLSRHASAG
jgi:MFS family permease